jgi:hypothetical protein
VHVINAGEIADLATVRHEYADALGTINYASPTNRYDGVTTILGEDVRPGLSLLDARIRRNLFEHGVSQPSLFHARKHGQHPTGGFHLWVGDHEYVTPTKIASILPGQS